MKVHVHIKEKAFDRVVARTNLTLEQIAKKVKITYGYLASTKNENLPEYRPSSLLRSRLMSLFKSKGVEVEFDDIFIIKDVEKPTKKNGRKKTAKK